MPKRHSREEDRISSLPDEILHHIFNFLLAASTVKTSFLSRRWRHVWSSSPNLHFDEYYFPFSYNEEFMIFVERVLLFSDATNLNCVSITTRGGCDMFRVLSWIYTIMKRNVRDLTIYHQQKELLKLPLKIFHLQSLKRLSVTSCIKDDPLPDSSYRNLEVLQLLVET
ncbi:F-box/LRR-repeat protein At4g14103-like [Asparagus officinalis]|uniref:F-box/LRR-repeat protein At4g14103-like n=1 Tax=Asparagus officinalis TaxID=4686 RepID=UPI00098E1D36|nr:F-box/LRR-repeat protein At4g14103-like [Asparagus officinalis]